MACLFSWEFYSRALSLSIASHQYLSSVTPKPTVRSNEGGLHISTPRVHIHTALLMSFYLRFKTRYLHPWYSLFHFESTLVRLITFLPGFSSIDFFIRRALALMHVTQSRLDHSCSTIPWTLTIWLILFLWAKSWLGSQPGSRFHTEDVFPTPGPIFYRQHRPTTNKVTSTNAFTDC